MTAMYVSPAVFAQTGIRALAYSLRAGWAAAVVPWLRPFEGRISRQRCEVKRPFRQVSVGRRSPSAPCVSGDGVHVV